MKDLIKDSLGWDCATWSAAFGVWEKFLPNGNSALELGNGRYGGLSLWLAEKGFDVTCSGYDEDYSTCPTQVYDYFVKHRLTHKVSFVQIDATNIPSTGRYDVICYKSMLGGIVRNGSLSIAQKIVDQCYDRLNPGGVLFFAENIASTRLHALLRKRCGAGKNEWRYFSIDELCSLYSNFSSFLYRTYGLTACLGRTEQQRNVLARFDLLTASVLPASWNYCFVGVAQK